ncbi:hypothetical protein TNCV_808311 [Trichonephila clavipes]|nr:hypothetical protein TNCV_808311 [Trichonephila clavipes]
MNQGATNRVFQTTVQRSLLRLVLRSRRLVHAPMLTAVHQQRRLEFSYRYRNWASNERGDRRERGLSPEFGLLKENSRKRTKMPTEQEAKPAVVTPSLQQWRSPSTFRERPSQMA